MQIPTHVDVAVVGAGPAGLASACILRQSGVNVIVLDAAAQPPTASRATVIHSRTLEVLETLNLTNSILERGNKVTQWNIGSDKTILAALDFATLKAKYPMVVTIPQTETETLLRQKLQDLGGSIYHSAKVTGVTDFGDKVELQVGTPDMKTTITAAYIVAADGLNSTVRSAVDIGFKGGEYSASFVTADCRLSSMGGLVEDALQLYMAPGTFILLVPEPHNIWRIVATLDDAPKNADVALYQRLVDERLPAGVKIGELTWTSRFHIHHRLAKQYRKGRVFLAGDAAHVHSPAGGQGMNIGLQDGIRLGQVLSEAIVDGKTSGADLDRYERERRPVAQGVVALTHRITKMATMKSVFLCWLRNWFIWIVMSFSFARSLAVFQLSELEH